MQYTDLERRVFGPYGNGREQVYGDPDAILRRLLHCLDGDPNRFLRDYLADRLFDEAGNETGRDPQKEALAFAATERLLDAARDAFGLVPFDPVTGQGVTERQALGVLFGFVDYLDGLKKKRAAPPISPRLTASPPAAWNTSIISDSSSTGHGCGCSEPGP